MNLSPISSIEKALMQGDCDSALALEIPSDLIHSDFLRMYRALICDNQVELIQLDSDSVLRSSSSSFDLLIQGLWYISKGDYTMGRDRLYLANTYSDASKNHWLKYELYRLETLEHMKIKYLEECIQIEPRYYLAVMDMTAVMDMGENALEMKLLLDGIILDYRSMDLYNSYAGVCYNLSAFSEANKWFEASLAISPNADAFYGLARVYQYKYIDFEKAYEYYNSSLQLRWNSQIAVDLAWLLFDNNKFIDSEVLFLKVIKNDSRLETKEQIAIFYIKHGAFVKAEKAIESIELSDDDDAFVLDALRVFLDSKMNRKSTKLNQYTKRYESNTLAIRYLDGLLQEM